jgi:hypothetical protein
MAKGQPLSRYQQGIVKRFYLHRGSILITRLQELVSDLALAEGKQADRLWKRAEDALRKLETEPPIPDSRIETICGNRDVAGLAQFVGELHAKA